MKKILKSVVGVLFLGLLSVNIFANCSQAGFGALNLFNGSAFPYDDDGCTARTAFTGCNNSSSSSAPEADNYYSVSVDFTYENRAGEVVTISGSDSKTDKKSDVKVRLEGTTDKGKSAKSQHYSKCNICGNEYSETLNKSF